MKRGVYKFPGCYLVPVQACVNCPVALKFITSMYLWKSSKGDKRGYKWGYVSPTPDLMTLCTPVVQPHIHYYPKQFLLIHWEYLKSRCLHLQPKRRSGLFPKKCSCLKDGKQKRLKTWLAKVSMRCGTAQSADCLNSLFLYTLAEKRKQLPLIKLNSALLWGWISHFYTIWDFYIL